MLNWRAIAPATALGMMLVACGGDEEASNDGAEADGAAFEDIDELTILGFSEIPESILDGFEEETGVAVNFEWIQSGDFPEVLQTRVVSQSDIDMINLRGGPEFSRYAQEGTFRPVDDDAEWRTLISDAGLEAGTYDGTLYGYSKSSYLIGVWANADIFNEVGIEAPENWAEFMDACSALNDAGIEPLVFSGGDGWTGQYIYHGALAKHVSENPEFMEDLRAGDATWHEADLWVRQIERFEDLADQDCFMRGGQSASYDDGHAAFDQGEVAMWMMGNWAAETIEESEPDFEITAFPVPYNAPDEPAAVASMLSDDVMTITSWTEKDEAASAFLDYLAQPENADIHAESQNRFTTSIDGENAPSVIGEFGEAWVAMLDDAVPYPMYMGPNVNNEGPGTLYDITAGSASAEDVVERFQEFQEVDNQTGY